MIYVPSQLQPEGVIQTGALTALVSFTGFLIFVLGRALYNVFLHPLRAHPGPLLWRMTSMPYDYHVFQGTLTRKVRELHKQYGPIVRLGPTSISITDSAVWKDVWSARNPEFPKDSRRTALPPNGYYSILNAPKDEHARFRRLLAHAFSEKGLRDQEPRIKGFVDLLIERLSEKAQSKESTDIVDWYTMAVFDVIGDLAWGESFNGLQDGKVHEWIPAVLGNSKFTVQSALLNQYGLGRFKPYLIDSSTNAGRQKNFKLAAEKADKRAHYGGVPRGDFWDRILIKSADDNVQGEGMIREEMVNNAAVLVLGGAETSATTLSGTTYLLLKHPEIMKKVQREIRSTFKSSDEIDVYSVSRLPYMLAVLDETMRIYPPVPDPMQRVAPPGSGGFVTGHYLPEWTTIHSSQLAASHMPWNFHRADDFVPERWLPDAPAEFANDDKAASQPFATGNRNCIGKNLAYAEMRLILAKVLYNFDFELDDKSNGGRDWFDQRSFGVWFKGPLHVKLTRAVIS